MTDTSVHLKNLTRGKRVETNKVPSIAPRRFQTGTRMNILPGVYFVGALLDSGVGMDARCWMLDGEGMRINVLLKVIKSFRGCF